MNRLQQIGRRKFPHIIMVAVSLTVAAVLLASPFHAAALGSFSLSRSSASVVNGKNVSFTLRISPGTQVTGVTANVQYDASKLQYITTSFSNSPFTIPLSLNAVGGTVTMDRGSFTSVSTNAVVATVTFKALASSGTASVSATGNAAFGSSYTGPSGASSSVTLTAPPPPASTNTPSTPSQQEDKTPDTSDTPKTSTNEGTKEQPDSSKPNTPTTKEQEKIDVNVDEANVQLTRAVFRVSTSENAVTYVRYGVEENKLITQTPETKKSKKHELILDEKLLTPGTTYYYQVIAEAPDGTKTVKEVSSFKTKGYSVEVTVLDKNNKPLKGKDLTMRSDPIQSETDKNGKVLFTDAAPGKHSVEYEADGKVYARTIIVENAVTTSSGGIQSAPTQVFAIIYDDLEQPLISTSTIVTILLMVAFVVAAIVLYSRGSLNGPLGALRHRFAKQTTGSSVALGPQDDGAAKTTEELTLEEKISRIDTPKQHAPGAVITPKGTEDQDDAR